MFKTVSHSFTEISGHPDLVVLMPNVRDDGYWRELLGRFRGGGWHISGRSVASSIAAGTADFSAVRSALSLGQKPSFVQQMG